MNELYQRDIELLSAYPSLMGVDEAGRGALAGPVVCAAVILDYGEIIEELNDSKQVTAKKRDKLYDAVLANAQAYHVIAIPPAYIDEHNILQATLEGMRQAITAILPDACLCLVDGNQLPRSVGFQSGAPKVESQSGNQPLRCVGFRSGAPKVESQSGNQPLRSVGFQSGEYNVELQSGNQPLRSVGFQSGAPKVESQSGNQPLRNVGFRSGAPKVESQSGNQPLRSVGFQSGAPKVESQSGNQPLRSVGFQSGVLQTQSGTGSLAESEFDATQRFTLQSVISGDALHACIAAASILAKVTRDRLMIELHDSFPNYGFARHKGYGTANHLRAIREFGPCEIHRSSFAPIRDQLQIRDIFKG